MYSLTRSLYQMLARGIRHEQGALSPGCGAVECVGKGGVHLCLWIESWNGCGGWGMGLGKAGKRVWDTRVAQRVCGAKNISQACPDLAMVICTGFSPTLGLQLPAWLPKCRTTLPPNPCDECHFHDSHLLHSLWPVTCHIKSGFQGPSWYDLTQPSQPCMSS